MNILRWLLWMVWVAFLCPEVQGDETADSKFLNHAILTLPESHFAGVSEDDRPALLAQLSLRLDDRKLDYRNQVLNCKQETFRELGMEGVTASVLVKLLPRKPALQNSLSPLVFLHLGGDQAELPGAGGERSFVFRWKQNHWVEVSKSVLPPGFDRREELSLIYRYGGLALPRSGEDGTVDEGQRRQLLWEDNRFVIETRFPYSSDCSTDPPFDPAELATLALTPQKNPRRLMWLIIYAGLEKEEQFRYLLDQDSLRENPSIALALASYEYALDQSETSLDFITGVMEEEGGGDTDSLLVISYMDEWDRTVAAFQQHGGGDGAAAEAKGMFIGIRRYLFPENFETHRDVLIGPR